MRDLGSGLFWPGIGKQGGCNDLWAVLELKVRFYYLGCLFVCFRVLLLGCQRLHFESEVDTPPCLRRVAVGQSQSMQSVLLLAMEFRWLS